MWEKLEFNNTIFVVDMYVSYLGRQIENDIVYIDTGTRPFDYYYYSTCVVGVLLWLMPASVMSNKN